MKGRLLSFYRYYHMGKKTKWNGASSFIKFIVGLGVIVLGANLLYSYIENGEVNMNTLNVDFLNNDTEEVEVEISEKEEKTENNKEEEKTIDREESLEKEAGPDTPDETFSVEEIEISENAGFNIEEVAGEESIMITDTSDTAVYEFGDNNAISVMPQSSESIIRNSMGVTTETPITIDGISGSEITGFSGKDGSEIHYIIISNGETMYFIRGDENFLERIQKDLRFE